jgi:hypothetical protein
VIIVISGLRYDILPGTRLCDQMWSMDSSPQAISEMFADRYMILYNSVPYNVQDLQTIHDNLDERIATDGFSPDYILLHMTKSRQPVCA